MDRDRRIWSLSGAFRAAMLILTAWVALVPAHAQQPAPLRGVALVIGNGSYEDLTPLANPEIDARAIENLFEDLGFETVGVRDADARKLRRAIERFVEDAEGADVAVVYYAGHGIEAGGENYLVPIDADLAALDDAGDKLVPLASLMNELRAAVSMTIVLLDACRNNPFPPGALVRATPDAEPAPVAVGGLGETRGVTRFGAATSATAADTNLGALIGFAAEPGRAAQDGEPGSHSPYAAAVLRHLAAMTGEEFGTVMRMVAEEVYLKTSGQQRPWVNENLRRLLYFGAAPAPVAGSEGMILAERRQLLLTIAALPDFDRRQVERVASAGSVPMDALYGMLRAMGVERPEDPAKLEEMLLARTRDVRNLLADRTALARGDAEIERLATLRRDAVRDGALSTAQALGAEIATRVAEIDKVLDNQEAGIAARRKGLAAELARNAEVSVLAFDHLKAADYYGQASRQVETWDRHLAWQYRRAELGSLIDHGTFGGDNATLVRAIGLGQAAERLVDGNPIDLAYTRNGIGMAQLTLGERETSADRLHQAADSFRFALASFTLARDPDDWATAQNNLGVALSTLGEREGGTANLDQSVDAFHAALAATPRHARPFSWAMIQNNLGTALSTLGERSHEMAQFEAAAAAFRTAREEYTRERAPLQWATLGNNLASVLSMIGERTAGDAELREAVALLRETLPVLPREKVPLQWAAAQTNLGAALSTLGERLGDAALLGDSAAAFRQALEESTRARVPLDWAALQNNLGSVLQAQGELQFDAPRLKQAVEAFEAALAEFTRERSPLQWAMVQSNLGSAEFALASQTGDVALLAQSIASFRNALLEYTSERSPLDWAMTQNNLGNALQTQGSATRAEPPLVEAVAAFAAALSQYSRATSPADWAATQNNLGYALLMLGHLRQGTAELNQAVAAFQAALAEQTRATMPMVWAKLQANLGIAYWNLGIRENRFERFDAAVAAFRAACEEQTRERMPLQWASAQDYLAGLLVGLGKARNDRASVASGRAAVVGAWEVYQANGYPTYKPRYDAVIAEADALLAAMK
jgi:uncharacterized caspase-like protein